jgi:hypothetical protein
MVQLLFKLFELLTRFTQLAFGGEPLIVGRFRFDVPIVSAESQKGLQEFTSSISFLAQS